MMQKNGKFLDSFRMLIYYTVHALESTNSSLPINPFIFKGSLYGKANKIY